MVRSKQYLIKSNEFLITVSWNKEDGGAGHIFGTSLYIVLVPNFVFLGSELLVLTVQLRMLNSRTSLRRPRTSFVVHRYRASTVQYSTLQYSTVQYSTVQCIVRAVECAPNVGDNEALGIKLLPDHCNAL